MEDSDELEDRSSVDLVRGMILGAHTTATPIASTSHSRV
jgi:hypothetical protein